MKAIGTKISVLVVMAVGVMLLSTSGLFAAQDMLVGVGNAIQRFTYNSETSQWELVGNFATGFEVWDFTYGPDQNGDGYPELYVGAYNGNVVRWIDGKTGGDASTAVMYATATDQVTGLAFQGDTLYVGLETYGIGKRNSSGTIDQVTEFWNPRHIAFGPDRTGDGIQDLYMVGAINDEDAIVSTVHIYGYYPDTGTWEQKTFSSGEPDGGGATRNFNFGLDWGPDLTGDGVGDLYLVDFHRTAVEIVDGATGAYVRDFATGFVFPLCAKWGPDGNLYVTDYTAGKLEIFNSSGAKINSVTFSAYSLHALAFMPEPLPTVGASNKTVQDPLMIEAASKYVWVFWGKVSNRTADAFDIDDGSGVIINVLATGNTVADGNYVTVKGTLSGAGTTTPTLTAESVTNYNP